MKYLTKVASHDHMIHGQSRAERPAVRTHHEDTHPRIGRHDVPQHQEAGHCGPHDWVYALASECVAARQQRDTVAGGQQAHTPHSFDSEHRHEK